MRGAFYEANNAASKILSWFSDGPDATRVWQHYTLGKIIIFNIFDTKVYSDGSETITFIMAKNIHTHN